MPEEGVQFMDRAEILTFEEIERFVRAAVPLGISKVRLTGGEPLLRRDLPRLIEKIAAIPGIRDMALTTNAVLLEKHAADLYSAGLAASQYPSGYAGPRTFRTYHAPRRSAARAGGHRRGCRRRLQQHQAQYRGGEGSGGTGHRSDGALLPRTRIRAALHRIHATRCSIHLGPGARSDCRRNRSRVLSREIAPLRAVPDADPRAPATEYEFTDGGGRVGFIASVSKPFCLNCNRIRLTSDGKLRYCLFAIDETDVRPLLRIERLR